MAEDEAVPTRSKRVPCLWIGGCALVGGAIVYVALHWRSQDPLVLAIGFFVLPALAVLFVTGAVQTFDRKAMSSWCLIVGAAPVILGFAFTWIFDDVLRRNYVLDRHGQFRLLADQCLERLERTGTAVDIERSELEGTDAERCSCGPAEKTRVVAIDTPVGPSLETTVIAVDPIKSYRGAIVRQISVGELGHWYLVNRG